VIQHQKSADSVQDRAIDEDFANETAGFNLIPFASMAGGWLGPLLMFWLYVWGPLRPFHYADGDLLPSQPLGLTFFAAAVAVWWLPSSYYQIRAFEQSGRLYELMGVRLFRWFVPDGDAANKLRRRRRPGFRIIRSRRYAQAFLRRTELSEKSHLVMLALGSVTAVFAWRIGWTGWAMYLGVGNVLVNFYPVLLQRYTRARLLRVLARV
jgi:Glycosyl-4,4'-diaponeurosporenoate acyltransferase